VAHVAAVEQLHHARDTVGVARRRQDVDVVVISTEAWIAQP